MPTLLRDVGMAPQIFHYSIMVVQSERFDIEPATIKNVTSFRHVRQNVGIGRRNRKQCPTPRPHVLANVATTDVLMFLGIEIGGTKLQLGVGRGDGEIVELARRDVDGSRGADGIREQIVAAGQELISRHPIERIAFGFGGPVLAAEGIVQTSHQVAGWDRFPIVSWCESALGRPTRLGNDCDVAGLAEACFGAGRDNRSLFYVTVGTGIGGGLIIDRRIHGTHRPAAAEIGHLRPGLDARTSQQTVEALAAGPGLAAPLQHHLKHWQENVGPHPSKSLDNRDAEDLLARCQGDPQSLSTKQIGEAARAGNQWACTAYQNATNVLGWAIAQMITLIAPEVVVVGGGVSLVGDLFFDPLRQAVDLYAFPPLKHSCSVVPAQLGESVVVHGALALAASQAEFGR